MRRGTCHRPVPPALPRRRWLQAGAALGLASLGASGCSPAPPLLRIGAHAWVGYQLMFLARDLGLLPPGQLRLVELPTASASLRALAAGTLDGAGLTLDEVLSARARGLMLRVVAVFDVSHGADVLLADPGIPSLAALRGRRVGVEQSATGALVLDAALTRGGLSPADVQLVPLTFDAHAAALRSGRVDAVVTFEPVRSQLLAEGAQVLFSSDMVPGLIVDVLAVRPEATQAQAAALRTLVAGLLQARQAWQHDHAGNAVRMSARLGIPPAAVVQAFGQLQLPDLAANRRWLGAQPPQLLAAAQRVQAVMQRAALLPAQAQPPGGNSPQPLAGDGLQAQLADPAFLPGA